VLKPGPQPKDSSEPTVEEEEDAVNDVHGNLVPHVLVYHPDEKIAALAHEYSELRSELVSPGPEYVTWPDNITWKNFAEYQLIPTLVYELEYPRTDRSVAFAAFFFAFIRLTRSAAFDPSTSLRKLLVFPLMTPFFSYTFLGRYIWNVCFTLHRH